MASDLASDDPARIELLATLSHELRGPLAAIQYAMQVLDTERSASETTQQVRTMIQRQLSQLVRLADDLRNVVSVTTGKLEVHRERIDLSAVLSTALETCQPSIDTGHHPLTVRAPAQLYIDADPVRLTQVLVNLIDNACKYSANGDHIEVTIERDADDALLRVRDAGIGIPTDMQAHVFDLFVQAEHSRHRGRGGLGIGLSLVKHIVELHDGSVVLQSDGPGAGCVFTVRVPAVRAGGVISAKT